MRCRSQRKLDLTMNQLPLSRRLTTNDRLRPAVASQDGAFDSTHTCSCLPSWRCRSDRHFHWFCCSKSYQFLRRLLVPWNLQIHLEIPSPRDIARELRQFLTNEKDSSLRTQCGVSCICSEAGSPTQKYSLASIFTSLAQISVSSQASTSASFCYPSYEQPQDSSILLWSASPSSQSSIFFAPITK